MFLINPTRVPYPCRHACRCMPQVCCTSSPMRHTLQTRPADPVTQSHPLKGWLATAGLASHAFVFPLSRKEKSECKLLAPPSCQRCVAWPVRPTSSARCRHQSSMIVLTSAQLPGPWQPWRHVCWCVMSAFTSALTHARTHVCVQLRSPKLERLVRAAQVGAIANAAGVGGGAIFSPIFNALVGFSKCALRGLTQSWGRFWESHVMCDGTTAQRCPAFAAPWPIHIINRLDVTATWPTKLCCRPQEQHVAIAGMHRGWLDHERRREPVQAPPRRTQHATHRLERRRGTDPRPARWCGHW